MAELSQHPKTQKALKRAPNWPLIILFWGVDTMIWSFWGRVMFQWHVNGLNISKYYMYTQIKYVCVANMINMCIANRAHMCRCIYIFIDHIFLNILHKQTRAPSHLSVKSPPPTKNNQGPKTFPSTSTRGPSTSPDRCAGLERRRSCTKSHPSSRRHKPLARCLLRIECGKLWLVFPFQKKREPVKTQNMEENLRMIVFFVGGSSKQSKVCSKPKNG